MEKPKIFLIFIIGGAFLILLQQDLIHLDKYNIYQRWNSANNKTDQKSSLKQTKHNSGWGYNKFIFDASNFAQNKEHKYLTSKFNPLSHLQIYSGNNVSRVLILAYFRSGSSFLGDLLQQNWKTFYTFEPLHYMSRQTRIDQANITEASKLIAGIFNCDFKQVPFYVEWANKNSFLLRWNKFLWNLCRFRSSMCTDPEIIGQTCQRSKNNIVKVVRLSIEHLEILWEQISSLNVKVIYLVRDPRGIYNSRKNMEWCNKKEECSNIVNICEEMRQDLNNFDRIKSKYGENLLLLRYEDLSSDPVVQTKDIFSKLKIEYSSSVSRFVRTHTKSHYPNDRNNNPYSTYRSNSSITAYQWMSELNTTEIEFAQQHCSDILRRLNYKVHL